MKINKIQQSIIQSTQNKKNSPASKLNTPTQKVDISIDESTLQKMTNILSNQPIIDESKVIEIKAALADGKIKLNKNNLVQSIMQFHHYNTVQNHEKP